MSLLLDPRDPVEHVIEDVTFRIRVFTSREFAHLLPHVTALEGVIGEDGEVVLNAEMVSHMESMLLQGLLSLDAESDEGMTGTELDRVPFEVWPELWAKVLEVNSVSEEDRKN